jgi:hypothetical protein
VVVAVVAVVAEAPLIWLTAVAVQAVEQAGRLAVVDLLRGAERAVAPAQVAQTALPVVAVVAEELSPALVVQAGTYLT